MANPVPVKTPKAQPPLSPRAQEVRLRVRYYRRMKLQRVHTLTVEPAARREPGSPGPVLTVRPVIPGAQVTPAEAEVNLASPAPRAVFGVVPLARGRLTGARVTVLHQGRPVQDIPLPTKAVTQRLTWVLAALTVLVPAFLLYFTKYRPLESKVQTAHLVRQAAEPDGELIDEPRVRDAGPKDGEGEAKEKEEKDAREPAAGGRKGGRQAAPGAAPAAPGMGDPPPAPEHRIVERRLGPKETLENEINENVPDIPGDYLSEGMKARLGDVPSFSRTAAGWIGTAYEFLCGLAVEHLSFYVAMTLLLLTLISWVTHSSRRGRRLGQTLSFSPPA